MRGGETAKNVWINERRRVSGPHCGGTLMLYHTDIRSNATLVSSSFSWKNSNGMCVPGVGKPKTWLGADAVKGGG